MKLIDRNQLPDQLKRMMVTQDDENLILDPQMILMEYFSAVDLTKGDPWQHIKDYTLWMCKNKIEVLNRKNMELKEANTILVDESTYQLMVYAQLVTIIKNRNKDIDVNRILRDARQKIEEGKRAREQMENKRIIEKAAVITGL